MELDVVKAEGDILELIVGNILGLAWSTMTVGLADDVVEVMTREA